MTTQLEDKLFSYACAIAKACADDEKFALSAGLVAKAALQFASAASVLVDACQLASSAQCDGKIDGGLARKIETLYVTVGEDIEHIFETELLDSIELVTSLASSVQTDEQATALEDWAGAIGIELHGLDDSDEEDDESSDDDDRRRRR